MSSSASSSSAATAIVDEQENTQLKKKKGGLAKVVLPGSFDAENHFYEKALNAQVSSTVSFFMSLSTERMVQRYVHLYPQVNADKLRELLTYKPKHFRWMGTDLFYVTSEDAGAQRQMLVVETNSCPSGNKSFPMLRADSDNDNGYFRLIKRTFKPMLEEWREQGKMIEGRLAVLYDKNPMEASGYAAAIATIMKEEVLIVEWYNGDQSASVRWTDDRVLEVQSAPGKWERVRACFRYVTQAPHKRLPVEKSRTAILNPIVACLAGGRNKMLADKAYEFFDAKWADLGTGGICRPETIRDLTKAEIPIYVRNWNYFAVIKSPYSNAGQGIWVCTSKAELDAFMAEPDTGYDAYICQALIGNSTWSSASHKGTFYHVGTVPNAQLKSYCADLRFMAHYNFKKAAWSPLALYSRRARKPLCKDAPTGVDDDSSWDVLGTNLSVKLGDNAWTTETTRLMLADKRDFDKLGISIDDLLDGFIQTISSAVAIDQMADQLHDADGNFDFEMFSALNKDDSLLAEIFKFGKK